MRDPPPYQSDEENQAPRKPRQEEPRRSTRNSEPNAQIGYLQDNPHGSNKNHNDRTRNKQEKSQNRYRERDQYYEEGAQSGNHQNNSLNWYQEREKFYKEREKSRNQQKRSQNHYQDNDETYKEREQNRSHQEMSKKQYQGRGDYYKERTNKNHQERSQSEHRERDQRPENYMYNKYQEPYTVDIKEPQPYYKAQRTFAPDGSQLNELEYEEPEPDGGILDCHKCKYLCTGRGILQIMEVILNALVLICIISSYFVLSGFSAGMSSGGFGGGYYPFEGQELRQLDQQFTVLRAPLLYGGLTVSVLIGTLTLGVLAAGSKDLLRLSGTWLVTEASFCTMASLCYGAAVGVFLHFALQINSTDICKKRERLYARNGLTWMNCDLAGTDGGAATFGILLVILYAVSVVLAGRAYRQRKSLQR
ncbi:MARVEL domain-containing protein 3 isoform 2-T4 [Rhinophrynus dorsalis]